MSKEKIALVTGANKGIGLETARQLAQQHITVLMGARSKEKGEAAAAMLRKEGYRAESLELDVTNSVHRQRAHDHIATGYGHLDILVNNAGIALETGLHPSQVPIDTVQKIFETNFFSTVALTQALLPLLRKSAAGRIVNLSSRLGSLSANAAAPANGWYDELGYNSSKAAVNMFTILLSHELADTPIKVNAAHPGWVRTDMGGPNAPLDTQDGAKTSVWLATLPESGPSGGFFHQQETMAW